MQGKPVKEDSPWMLLKISLMFNITKFYTNDAGGSPSNGRSCPCRLNFLYLKCLQAIRVELKGDFIYDITPFYCDNSGK
jgi:hypothetical protein